MNKATINGGGFPGTSKTWRFIRDMATEVHNLASALGGENCIVKGGEVNNGVVSDGIVIIDGEALPLVGGAGSKVEVIEEVEQVQYFQDSEADGQGDIQDAYFNRYAKIGATGIDYNSLTRLAPLSEIAKRLPPKECPLPFSGPIANIPSGWQLADGSNGTPDLQGMFIAGYDPEDEDHNEIGKTGGASEVTLTDKQMPVHKHTGSFTFHPTNIHCQELFQGKEV